MKKQLVKFFLLFFAFIGGVAQIALAGHNEKIRSKCRWYAKKYVAEAHLGGPGIAGGPYVGYAQSRDNGCEWAKADEVQLGACGKNCEARSYAGGNQAYGSTNVPCKINWDGNPSLLYQEIMEGTGNQDEEQNMQETAFDTNFGYDFIDLSNIKIHLKADNNSTRNNSYTITLWLPQDDTKNGIEDETITAEKTIVAGTVNLVNGRVTVNGNVFAAPDFQINNDGVVTTVDYIGGTKHLTTPVIADNMDIEVSSTGDIKDNETALFRKTANAESASVLLYPNPSSQNVTIAVNGQKNNTVTIQVYDATGKLVLKSSEQIQTDNTSILLNTSMLTSGEYFILVSSRDKKILKQFIKK